MGRMNESRLVKQVLEEKWTKKSWKGRQQIIDIAQKKVQSINKMKKLASDWKVGKIGDQLVSIKLQSSRLG